MNWIDFNGDPSDGCEKKIEKKSGTPTASDENNGDGSDGVGSDGSSSSSTTKGKKDADTTNSGDQCVCPCLSVLCNKDTSDEENQSVVIYLVVFAAVAIVVISIGIVGYKKYKQVQENGVAARRNRLRELRSLAHDLHNEESSVGSAVPTVNVYPTVNAVGIQMVQQPMSRSIFENAEHEARILRLQTRTPVAVAYPIPMR